MLRESAIGAYAALGWSLMALPLGVKKSDQPGWQNAPDDVPGLLVGGDSNLAVRLGPRSGMLADVDLDSEEAVRVAPYFLPPTGTRSGTDARPGSHWWYVAPDGPTRGVGTSRYSSPSRGAAVSGGPMVTHAELRWRGGYTVLPPSVHPSGGVYGWEGRPADDPLPPPPVAWEHLDRSVRETAGAALLLVQYAEWEKQRVRHHATLALGGALLTEGWEQARVERFVFALASAGADEEAADRVDNVRSAADRLRRGDTLHGWPSLAGLAGSATVDQLKKFLGLGQGGGGWAAIMGRQTPTNGPVPPTGGAPGVAPAQQQAPVISTAQQAAQGAASKAKANYSAQKVALDVALEIQRAFPLARDEGMALYRYRNGVYVSEGVEIRLRRAIEQEVLGAHGEDYLSKRMEDEVLHRLAVGADPLEERPPRGWLNLANGRLDIATGVLESHNSQHRTPIKLPVVYDKQASCPAIERFCAQVFPADAVAAGVPWEVVALCCMPIRGIDKAILLLGEGENGKGVFLDIVQAFVGASNASHVSLQRMGDNKFATAELRGKVLNICSDLPLKRLDDSGDFKMIVSGETIRAERKHQQAFDFSPFCRLLFSANNLPESADTSMGYTRRWHIIPFGATFGPDNPERRSREELQAELLTPAELSGLLNRALPAMRKFLANGVPAVTDSMKELVDEFRAANDPFPTWLANNVVQGQGWLATADIAQKYQERMARHGRTYPVTPNAVGAAVKELFPHAVRVQQRVGGTGQVQQANGVGQPRWGWRGVSWRLGFTP